MEILLEENMQKKEENNDADVDTKDGELDLSI